MKLSDELIEDLIELTDDSVLIEPNEIKNCVNKEAVFLLHLEQLMVTNDTPIQSRPRLHDESINIYKLAKVVQKLGGFEQVKENKRWKDVARLMGSSHFHVSTFKSLKHSYIRYIQPFIEHIHSKKTKNCCEYFKKPLYRDINSALKAQFPWTQPAFESSDIKSPEGKYCHNLVFSRSDAVVMRKTLRASTREKYSSKLSPQSDKEVFSDESYPQKNNSTEKKQNSYHSESSTEQEDRSFNSGDIVLVKYHRVKIPYEGIIQDKKKINGDLKYLIHYYGWNDSYDEWVSINKIISRVKNKRGRKKSGRKAHPHNQKPLRELSPPPSDDALDKKQKCRRTYNSLQDVYMQTVLANSLKEYQETSGAKTNQSQETVQSGSPPTTSNSTKTSFSNESNQTPTSQKSLNNQSSTSQQKKKQPKKCTKNENIKTENVETEDDPSISSFIKQIDNKKAQINTYMDKLFEVCRLQRYDEREVLLSNSVQLLNSLKERLLPMAAFYRQKLEEHGDDSQ